MTATRPVVIRLPLPLRVYVVVFLCFWCGIIGVAASTAWSPGPALVLAGMLVFGLAIGYRLFRLSVTLERDQLVIRNLVRIRRVPRRDVQALRLGPVGNQPFMQTIYLLLRDDSVLPLDAVGRPSFGRRGRAVLATHKDVLESWLVGR